MNRLAMLAFLVLPTLAFAHHHHFHHHHHVSSSHHTSTSSSHHTSGTSSSSSREPVCVRWALVGGADAGVDAGVVDAGAEENVIAFASEVDRAYAEPREAAQVTTEDPVELAKPVAPTLARADLQDQLDTADDDTSEAADGGEPDEVDDEPRIVCVEWEPAKGVGCSVLGFAAPTVLLAALWLKPRRRSTHIAK